MKKRAGQLSNWKRYHQQQPTRWNLRTRVWHSTTRSRCLRINRDPPKYLNAKLIEKHHALPIYTQGNTPFIAVSDPTNITGSRRFRLHYSLHTEALLVDERKLQYAIHRLVDPTDDDFAKSMNDEAIGDIEVGDVDDDAYKKPPKATAMTMPPL